MIYLNAKKRLIKTYMWSVATYMCLQARPNLFDYPCSKKIWPPLKAGKRKGNKNVSTVLQKSWKNIIKQKGRIWFIFLAPSLTRIQNFISKTWTPLTSLNRCLLPPQSKKIMFFFIFKSLLTFYNY